MITRYHDAEEEPRSDEGRLEGEEVEIPGVCERKPKSHGTGAAVLFLGAVRRARIPSCRLFTTADTHFNTILSRMVSPS